MSFGKNGKNLRYEKLNMSAESKERILNECLKVLDEEYEKESVSSGATSIDELNLKTDELSLKRNEKIERENEYNDWFKKLAVASFSIVATGAIIAGAMNYNKISKKPNSAKDTSKIQTTSRDTESVSILGETSSEEGESKKKDKNANNGNDNGGNNGSNQKNGGNSGNSKNGETAADSSNSSSKFSDAVSPAKWIGNRLDEICKDCYNPDGSLKEGYTTKTFTSANGKTFELAGKDIIELSPTQDKGNYDVDVNSNVVYFVCGDSAYQLVLDAVFAHKNYGTFKEPHSAYMDDYDYRLKMDKTGVDYYHRVDNDEYYIIDEENNKTRKILDEIKIVDAPISGIEYDWNRNSLKFTCDKMGNQQADYDLPGIKCYKMGCFSQDGTLVNEISIVEDNDGSDHYYNVINDVENGSMYFVSGENKLYRIDGVVFDKLSKAFDSGVFNSIKDSYPSMFNDHTCQFDNLDSCLGLLRSVIPVNADYKCTLLAEDVRYIKTNSNEYLQTSSLDEDIIVISTSGKATIVTEDEKVTYK